MKSRFEILNTDFARETVSWRIPILSTQQIFAYFLRQSSLVVECSRITLARVQYFNPPRYLVANSSVYSWTCNFRSEKRIVARARSRRVEGAGSIKMKSRGLINTRLSRVIELSRDANPGSEFADCNLWGYRVNRWNLSQACSFNNNNYYIFQKCNYYVSIVWKHSNYTRQLCHVIL